MIHAEPNFSLHWTGSSRFSLFQGGRLGRLLPASERSPTMRAERAKLKSHRDDKIVAQGKRSAALGYGGKMISSFFPSGLGRRRRAKPEGKKEVVWGGLLPRASASAAWPWAIIMPPLRGSGTANNWVQATPSCAWCLFLRQRPGAPDADR